MADTLSVLAGAIPVVGGVVSSLINNADTASNNAQNRAFQEQQQQQQETYNTASWQAQADYNSPINQMARLKAAGLNPNLVYGSGQVSGNVAELPAPAPRVEYVSQAQRAPDLASDTEQGIKAFNDTSLTAPKVSNLQAQTQNTGEDTVLKQVQELLDTVMGNKVNAEIPTIAPTAAANVANLNSASFKNLTDANVNSFLAPYQADVAQANTAKAKADTSFVISENVRQAASNAMSLKEAVARMAQMAVQNAHSQADIDQINANLGMIQNSKLLQQMDINMRNNGMMPHDPPILRALEGISHIFSGGAKLSGGQTNQPQW